LAVRTRPAPKGAALITGSSRRVGRALALKLAEAGYPVIVHARHADDEAHQTVSLIKAQGGKAAIATADLSDRGELSTLMTRAAEPFGPLEVLVNSASVFHDDRLQTVTAEGWDAHFASNLYAPILLAQAFAAQADALPGDADPSIVNLIDQRVLKPNPQFFTYSLTKAALHSATVTMAQALAPHIRVNGIGPGPTLPSIHQSPEQFAAEEKATLLQRGSPPDALAEALLYLVGAKAVTGQMIAVDGGQHLNWKTPDIEGDS
jgi:NAD(P)-dependent dehydrogenase (short-subunit alcohol dehydrogenase family)